MKLFVYASLLLVAEAAKTATLVESSDGSGGVMATFTPIGDDRLAVEVSYEGQAYVALAFSNDRLMPNSIAVIGQLSDNTVQKYNMTARSFPLPLSDEQQTLTDTSITYDGAVTTLSFTKLLVESNEPAISLTEDNFFLYALGQDGVGTSLQFHARFGSEIVSLAAEEQGEDAEEEEEDNNSEFIDLGDGRRQLTQTLVEGMEATLVTDDNNDRLEVTVTYEGESYIAVGFSEDDKMPGSIGVIGLPGDNSVLKYDMASRTTPTVLPDAQQTLENVSVNFDGAFTSMTFTKLIAEESEPEIFLSGDNFFLWAHGSDGNTNLQFHAQFGHVEANLLTGDAEASDPNENKGLWATHGICMALAWVFLIPVGIAFSAARAFVPGQGNWFMAHRIINSLGVVLTIVGFAIAVRLISKEQGDTAKHFQLLRHHKVGLVVFIFAVINAAWGIFRPHAPHAPEPTEDNVENGKPTAPVAAPEKSTFRLLFEYGHRVFGLVAIVLGWFNVSSGAELFSNQYQTTDLSLASWVVVAIIAIATLVLGVAGRRREA